MAGKDERTRKNAWLKLDDDERRMAFDLGTRYIDFLNQARTERETTEFIEAKAREYGFVDLKTVSGIQPRQKLYMTRKNKISALISVGDAPLEDGFNIVASHVDCPRLDLKPMPLYETDGMVLLKTHYYGGIKKYQWTAIPLALHGVVVKKDGSRITIRLGEEPGELAFTITDLLPHLAREQMEKKMSEGVGGESLNILVGSIPGEDGEQERIKKAILKILQERYGIEENDFTSAELEAVPAFPARDIGFDRSMVGGYGQDDRVSVFTSLEAMLNLQRPQRTAVCIFADKEEIGSVGNTGLRSYFTENLAAELLHRAGACDYYQVRKALASSHALSADVNAAVDPNYEQVFEKMNNSFLGEGVVVTKYTGSRGKYDASDANPEFVAWVRRIFDDNRVPWQIGELGKVDEGGGGTVSQYLARYGMEVLDCGVALLGMHSPFEVTSKADLYAAYKGYHVFLQADPTRGAGLWV
ncbi:MAG: aminopeptidase [Syntrophomonadaceae bacterium]|jgi:aspartyl aminopeptidase|nr:aminopeptidase [Syntrophomonadaceae bacterium]